MCHFQVKCSIRSMLFSVNLDIAGEMDKLRELIE